MKKLEFVNNKEFAEQSGNIITMKGLITMHDKQYVQCHDNDKIYPARVLTEMKTNAGSKK